MFGCMTIANMQCSKIVVTTAAKIIFFVILFIVFFKWFALVQINEYLKEGVFVEVSQIYHPDGVPAPQFTLCALNASNGFGWKVALQDLNFTLPCDDEKINTFDCILDLTYNTHDYSKNESITQNFIYSEEITNLLDGQCLSLSSEEKLVSSFGGSNIRIPLSKKFSFNIYVYYPLYFFPSENPRASPGLKIHIDHETMQHLGWTFWNLEIIQHEKLNLDNQPCIADETYSFTECLRLHLESKADCRLPWHEKIHEKRSKKFCTTMKEFMTITGESGFAKYGESQLKEVIHTSGCLAPCKYKEIRAVGPPRNYPYRLGEYVDFSPNLVTTDIRKETEKLTVPFPTLIANIGGLLGLFLGFSFVMFWKWLEYAFRYIVKLNSKVV